MYKYSYLVEQVEVLLSQFEWKSRDETRLTDCYRIVTPANARGGGLPITSRYIPCIYARGALPIYGLTSEPYQMAYFCRLGTTWKWLSRSPSLSLFLSFSLSLYLSLSPYSSVKVQLSHTQVATRCDSLHPHTTRTDGTSNTHTQQTLFQSRRENAKVSGVIPRFHG